MNQLKSLIKKYGEQRGWALYTESKESVTDLYKNTKKNNILMTEIRTHEHGNNYRSAGNNTFQTHYFSNKNMILIEQDDDKEADIMDIIRRVAVRMKLLRNIPDEQRRSATPEKGTFGIHTFCELQQITSSLLILGHFSFLVTDDQTDSACEQDELPPNNKLDDVLIRLVPQSKDDDNEGDAPFDISEEYSHDEFSDIFISATLNGERGLHVLIDSAFGSIPIFIPNLRGILMSDDGREKISEWVNENGKKMNYGCYDYM